MIKNKFFVGQEASVNHKISESDIENFISLSGDTNPIHFDDNFAADTYLKKPIAHGMLGATFISNVIGTHLPGPGALWMSQTLDFVNPARVGDNLKITAKIINIIELENIVHLETKIEDSSGKIITKGRSIVRVLQNKKKVTISKSTTQIKTAILIGGTGGLGEAIARKLHQEKFDLLIAYNSNESKARELKAQLTSNENKCEILKVSLEDEQSILNFINECNRKYETITHLIFAASLPINTQSIHQSRWSSFQEHLDNQVKSVFELTKALLPSFKENKYGNIIVIGSALIDSPIKNWIPYSTAKSALRGLIKGLSLELGTHNIRVNMVSPSLIETNLTGMVSEREKSIIRNATPLNQLTTPGNVADAVYFLASDLSSNITGQDLKINGGVAF